MFRYPIDVNTSQTKDKTLSVESHLAVAKTSDEQSPLKIYHENFSFYKFAIIEKTAAVKAVTSNVNVKELEDIFRRTDYAFKHSMDYENEPIDSSATSPAYTVKIASGTFKGKTPAEVLIENPDNKDALNKQYQWLKSNLAKYPNNKTQMDAIADAAKLLNDGALTSVTKKNGQRIRLYPSTTLPVPKALTRKPREDGMCPVYEMEIFWNIGDNTPIEVSIKNYYAPIEKKEDGRITPIRKQATDRIERSMRIGEADWLNHIREIKTDMANFEMLNAKSTRADAINVLMENRKNKADSSGA